MLLIIPLTLHESYTIILNLSFYVLYKFKFPFFEQFKSTNEPWPWEKDNEKFKAKLYASIPALFINHILVHILVVLPTVFGEFPHRSDIESYPGFTEIIPQVLIFILVEDTTFYWSHRLFHTPFLYKRIHKQHHEYNDTLAFVAEFSHPIEFAVNIIATGLGPLLLGNKTHMLTVYLWYAIRTFEAYDGHSGYEFPWSPFRLLPMSGGSDYHNYHHLKNIGNYGSFFTYWDTICNTNNNYWKYMTKKHN